MVFLIRNPSFPPLFVVFTSFAILFGWLFPYVNIRLYSNYRNYWNLCNRYLWIMLCIYLSLNKKLCYETMCFIGLSSFKRTRKDSKYLQRDKQCSLIPSNVKEMCLLLQLLLSMSQN